MKGRKKIAGFNTKKRKPQKCPEKCPEKCCEIADDFMQRKN